MNNDDYAIAIYQGMEVIFDDNGDPWLTQGQISELLGVSKQAVSDMLNVAIRLGEIPAESVVNLRLTVANGKSYNVKHYDFDAVLIVGYRSKENSERTKAFRQWVSAIVKTHLRAALKQAAELRQELSSEANARRTAEMRTEWLETKEQMRTRAIDRRYEDYED